MMHDDNSSEIQELLQDLERWCKNHIHQTEPTEESRIAVQVQVLIQLYRIEKEFTQRVIAQYKEAPAQKSVDK